MGIYIKGMDMPKDFPTIVILYPTGQVVKPNAVGYDDYEAVSVPPHGRLIDADEIARYKERIVVDADKIDPEIRYVVDTKYIKEAPTIIPEEDER